MLQLWGAGTTPREIEDSIYDNYIRDCGHSSFFVPGVPQNETVTVFYPCGLIANSFFADSVSGSSCKGYASWCRGCSSVA
jgi:hypothetical protein